MSKYKSLTERIAASHAFKKPKEEKSATSGPKYSSLAEKLLLSSPALMNEIIRKRIWNQRLAARSAGEPERRTMKIQMVSPPSLP